VGRTILENIGSMQKNSTAERKMAAKYSGATHAVLRAADAGRDASKTLIGSASEKMPKARPRRLKGVYGRFSWTSGLH
jgi:hypothetical protein